MAVPQALTEPHHTVHITPPSTKVNVAVVAEVTPIGYTTREAALLSATNSNFVK